MILARVKYARYTLNADMPNRKCESTNMVWMQQFQFICNLCQIRMSWPGKSVMSLPRNILKRDTVDALNKMEYTILIIAMKSCYMHAQVPLSLCHVEGHCLSLFRCIKTCFNWRTICKKHNGVNIVIALMTTTMFNTHAHTRTRADTHIYTHAVAYIHLPNVS